MPDEITITGARLHNLVNLTVHIPKNRLVVLTGLSGSGKSTLAFDILHKEGQRQYMESLGFVDYVSRAPVERITGLSPTISVDQHRTARSPRSTVGTATEVYTYLRVLYARVGRRPCPTCGGDVPPASDPEAWNNEADGAGLAEDAADLGGATYPCPHCGAPVPELGMAHFSFNKPAGACPTCTGLGATVQPDLGRLIDPARSVADGGVLIWNEAQARHYGRVLQSAGDYYGFPFDLTVPIQDLSAPARDLLLYGVYGEPFRRHYPGVKPPATVGQGNVEGIVANVMRRYNDHARNPDAREGLEQLLTVQTCPDCTGDRLRPESRAVTVGGRTIVDLSRLPLTELAGWLEGLPALVPADEGPILGPILDDLRARVRRLIDVGAGYLALERASPSLSAGEAQRLRLASLLGSGLTGVLYVLDEPTIGLHQRDTQRLVAVLRQLRDLGNTVLVVEHDLDLIRAADHVIDMGPGAGEAGGQVVAAGTPAQVALVAASVTGRCLAGWDPIPGRARRSGTGQQLVIHGAREHNLKDLTVALPLGCLIAVTGVSGSGKSSLMLDILDRAARQRFYGAGDPPGEHRAIAGWEHLDKVVTLDQSAIARTPRSNAATYTDTFTPIRQAFADTTEAQARGLTPGHFSFNTPGGRCERCQGAGTLTVNMHFLPDVEVRCPACHGKRFLRDLLEVKYRGYSISDVLEMSIAEAAALFVDVPAAHSKLALMNDVGMGYLKLGQAATTLSGGEAQRVKLARELSRTSTGRTLYLLDEPTTGLHVADVAHLLVVLHGLVDAGNTVVVIEHHLDVIRASDWVIDLGPEGGDAGGQIVALGTPEAIAQVAESHTARYLRERLA